MDRRGSSGRKYSAYGLNPDRDFDKSLSIARRQLNIIKYINAGFDPVVDPLIDCSFTKDESLALSCMKVSTVQGMKYKNVYSRHLYRTPTYNAYPAAHYDWYKPIIERITRNRICTNMDEIRKIVESISKKYGVHPITRSYLTISDHEAYSYGRLIDLNRIAGIPVKKGLVGICKQCKKKHSRQSKVYEWVYHPRLGSRREMVKSGRLEDLCMICYMNKRRQQKRAELATQEAKQIGCLIRKLSTEIKANGNKN